MGNGRGHTGTCQRESRVERGERDKLFMKENYTAFTFLNKLDRDPISLSSYRFLSLPLCLTSSRIPRESSSAQMPFQNHYCVIA